MRSFEGGILADDMGLEDADYLRWPVSQKKKLRILILAPSDLIYNLETRIFKFKKLLKDGEVVDVYGLKQHQREVRLILANHR